MNDDRKIDDQTLEILLERLRRAATAVEYEYAENDRRLTWFLVFQAFLFQAYATALQTLGSAADSASPTLKALFSHTHYFVWVICMVGIVTSGVTVVGTFAGMHAAAELKRTREQQIEAEASQFGIEKMGFGVDTCRHWLGLLPTLVFPSLLLICWLGLLVRALASKVADSA